MKNYLGFTVVAAIVTTFGTLLGLFLKDFLFVYYFDKLKEKRSLEAISKKFKDPILLSASELAKRLTYNINNHDEVLESSTVSTLFKKTENTASSNSQDSYYFKYRLTSTLYRFCSFFGWLEIYRQEITF